MVFINLRALVIESSADFDPFFTLKSLKFKMCAGCYRSHYWLMELVSFDRYLRLGCYFDQDILM